MDAAPLLETERLTLRSHRASDFEDFAAIWGDARVVEYISVTPATPEESWARLLRNAGLWPLLGYGSWAIEERATGRYVGHVGVTELRRAMTPPLDAPEGGWVLAPWAYGRGYATEAVRAMLAWCDAHLAATKTVCIVRPENVASLRVAAKSGYVEVARREYKGHAVVVFERSRGRILAS